jgi:hypothetical protein
VKYWFGFIIMTFNVTSTITTTLTPPSKPLRVPGAAWLFTKIEEKEGKTEEEKKKKLANGAGIHGTGITLVP